MVNVLFCGNAGVFDGMLTCALSMLMRTASEEPFRFFIFTMDLSERKPAYVPLTSAQTDALRTTIRRFNPANELEVVDVGDLYRRYFAGCPNETAYCSPYTLIRLFARMISAISSQ